MGSKAKIANDFTGKQFGKVLVIGPDLTPGQPQTMKWKCHCECGNDFITYWTTLKRGSIKSCGCTKRVMPNSNKPKYTEYGEAAFRELYGSYIRNAKNRGFIFELTLEEFRTLTKGNCNYCDNPPLQILKRRYKTGDYVYNGIDREDNSKGYITPTNKSSTITELIIP